MTKGLSQYDILDDIDDNPNDPGSFPPQVKQFSPAKYSPKKAPQKSGLLDLEQSQSSQQSSQFEKVSNLKITVKSTKRQIEKTDSQINLKNSQSKGQVASRQEDKQDKSTAKKATSAAKGKQSTLKNQMLITSLF